LLGCIRHAPRRTMVPRGRAQELELEELEVQLEVQQELVLVGTETFARSAGRTV